MLCERPASQDLSEFFDVELALHIFPVEDLQVPLEERKFPRVEGLGPEGDEHDSLGPHREFVQMLDERQEGRREPVVKDHILEAIDQDEPGGAVLLDELLNRLRDGGHCIRAEVVLPWHLGEPSNPDVRGSESRSDFFGMQAGQAETRL